MLLALSARVAQCLETSSIRLPLSPALSIRGLRDAPLLLFQHSMPRFDFILINFAWNPSEAIQASVMSLSHLGKLFFCGRTLTIVSALFASKWSSGTLIRSRSFSFSFIILISPFISISPDCSARWERVPSFYMPENRMFPLCPFHSCIILLQI